MNATLESQLTLMQPKLANAPVYKDWMGSMSDGEREAVLVFARLGAALHFAFREATRLTRR